MPDVNVSINENAQPDKRSYKVDFSKFAALAKNHQPVYDLKSTINDLYEGLKSINFNDKNFRNSSLIRLQVVNALIEKRIFDQNLKLS